MHNSLNRRRFERFQLPHTYTSIALRRLESETFDLEGHAYDVSEGGLRFELDQGVDPGTPVAVRLDLPVGMLAQSGDIGPGRSIFLFGNIVWLDDAEAGPVRMALAVTRFAREGDRERLARVFSSRRMQRAA